MSSSRPYRSIRKTEYFGLIVRFPVVGIYSSTEIEDSALDELIVSIVELMKRGFSLVELMIVVAVLGILAAIVVPQFQEHATQAKEAVAKDSLRILRSAIELYAARHSSVPPGYKSDNPQNPPTSLDFCQQLVTECRYISGMPQNPFNKRKDIRMIGNSETFPQNPTNQFGWVYQPATKTIRLDWQGTGKDGIRYYDY